MEHKLEKFYQFICSQPAVSILLLIVIVASIAGSLLPQELASAYIYKSFWFMFLLLIILLINIYCRLTRIPANLKGVSGFVLHLSIIVILTGAYASFIYETRGRLSLGIGQSSSIIIRENNSIIHLPFKVRLDDFNIELYPNSESSSNQPGDHIKNFISNVTIIDNKKEISSKAIKVNHPLVYQGYKIYQANYDSKNLSWSGFLIKKDPGVKVVFTGYFLFIFALLLKIFAFIKVIPSQKEDSVSDI
jgi:cytochrome c biogenesis protein ResB